MSQAALAAAPRRLKGRMHDRRAGAFLSRGPGRAGDPRRGRRDARSTPRPSIRAKIQHMVAQVLGIARTRSPSRCGAWAAASAARRPRAICSPASRRWPRRRPAGRSRSGPTATTTWSITGKRHDFVVDYDVGFDDDGRIQARRRRLFAARCGYSADLSGPVTDRALFHCRQRLLLPGGARCDPLPLNTNTVSNTAFRGFGGPQGMVGGERWIEEIAYALGKDPLEIRKRNFYGEAEPQRHALPPDGRGQHHPPSGRTSWSAARDYAAPARGDPRVQRGRAASCKKGIALTPVKFGISFTATWLQPGRRAGARLSRRLVHLSHGGTEMGQGLHIKVAQVVAEAFRVDVDQVKITATTTGKVPNTSATAASSGTDLNGMAALAAARTIKARLVDFAAEHWSVPTRPGRVPAEPACASATRRSPFAELVDARPTCAASQLSSTGFYKTPKIHWDRAAGAASRSTTSPTARRAAEVTIDTLTGEYQVDRVDMLHDVGRSLNPAIDIGPGRGRLHPGHGLADDRGAVVGRQGAAAHPCALDLQDPVASRRAAIFNVALLAERRRTEDDDLPLQGGRRAAADARRYRVVEALSRRSPASPTTSVCPQLDTPATPERVLMAIERCAERARRA